MSDVQQLENNARNQKWDSVDRAIPRAVRKSEVISAAMVVWINDSDVNVRDLAGSVLEKAKLTQVQFRQVTPDLLRTISNDGNNYAGFRAACALAAHGYKAKEVLGVLRRFESDKDVGKIARKYLGSQ